MSATWAQRALAVAEVLNGSCIGLSAAATRAERASPEFCDALDELVRECECCNWWVETYEVDENGHCSDCQDA